MATKRLTLQLGDRTLVFVDGGSVEHWWEEEARRRLHEIAAEWPGREALLRLSDETLGPSDDIDAAIEHLVRAFDRDELLAVRVEDFAGAQITSTDAGDWDAPRLADLPSEIPRARSDDRGRVAKPKRATEPRASDGAIDRGPDRPTDTWTTFVAFAVVDRDGNPLGGESRCTIAAKLHTHALGEAPIEIAPIDAHARVLLELRDLKQRGVES